MIDVNEEGKYVYKITHEEADRKEFNTRLIMAEENGISIGEKRGEKRGERRGERRGKRIGLTSVAEKMIEMSFPIDLIQKVTGLDEKEIEYINLKK